MNRNLIIIIGANLSFSENCYKLALMLLFVGILTSKIKTTRITNVKRVDCSFVNNKRLKSRLFEISFCYSAKRFDRGVTRSSLKCY